MRIASLGSGSKGNGTLIETDKVCLLLDLGFSIKETIRRLERLGRSPLDLTAILVSHEHADHINGVGQFSRKFKLPVYMTPGTYNPSRIGLLEALHKVNCHRNFTLGDLLIEPVPVPHDAREPCQYIFCHNNLRVGVLTDLGHITPFVIERYRECDLVLLECNYDQQMLASGPYPQALKNRIGGNLGHLCNDQAAELVGQLDLARLKYLVVSHVSEKNNLPELALDSLKSVLTGWRGNLLVSDQSRGLSWITL